MDFRRRVGMLALAFTLGFGDLFMVGLGRGKVLRDRRQHLVRMVAQLGVVHGQGGRFDGARKIFPCLEDRFHIVVGEFTQPLH